MSEDPIVKAVAGLMTAHHTTQQAVVSLGHGLAATNQVVAALQASMKNLEVTVSVMEASLADEGDRIQALLEAVTTMAHNSTDTQKRLTALEEGLAQAHDEIARLKDPA